MIYQLLKDGKVIYESEYANDLYAKLLRIQPNSCAWALEYEGYSIEEVKDERGSGEQG
jgi:CRISPR/Cas system-associated protein Cas7 (RAMP superfamily)